MIFGARAEMEQRDYVLPFVLHFVVSGMGSTADIRWLGSWRSVL